MRYLAFNIILAVMLLPLGCDDNPTGPENVLVLSDGFERLGSPTYTGWQIAQDSIEFDIDTPVEGSVYSLMLRPGNDIAGTAEKFLDNEHGSGIYQFSVWAKMSSGQPSQTGYVQFGVFAGDVVTQAKSTPLTDTSWAWITITDTLTLGQDEQLYLKLSCGAGHTGDQWYSLFDAVRLEKINR